MCQKCDELEARLMEETKRRITPKAWWGGIISAIVTILIFTVTTIFATGKVASQVEEHVKSDPTFKEMVETFITRKEQDARKETVDKELLEMKEMLNYLYRKEGGKPLD